MTLFNRFYFYLFICIVSNSIVGQYMSNATKRRHIGLLSYSISVTFQYINNSSIDCRVVVWLSYMASDKCILINIVAAIAG